MPLNVLYYSNYCKHSQEILKYVVKTNLTAQLNCVCVDKRSRDQNNNQMLIMLENGTKVALPPTVSSVPSLLLVNKNYVVAVGLSNIMRELNTEAIPNGTMTRNNERVEPSEKEFISYEIGSYTSNQNIVSERFTDYNLSPEALSSKGQSKDRDLYNYVPVDGVQYISTPDETYKPDKMSADMTIDRLQQMRNQDISI